ncbi:MAG TPA: hypothetical protein PLY32_05315 [Salinivirgaceae bacterium]|nr:hypothetical protein [Salinivirgaceae bacterium]
MKRITLLLALAAFVLGAVSCGGSTTKSSPTAEAEKHMKLLNELTNLAVNVAKDEEITDKEAKEIMTQFKKFLDKTQSLYKKYKDDQEAMKEFQDCFGESDAISKFNDAFSNLDNLEGSREFLTTFENIKIEDYEEAMSGLGMLR